ncbi:MAG: acyl carrier protein, partial [Planctomycetota bacterium]
MPEPQAFNDLNRLDAIRQDVLHVIDEATGLVIASGDSSVPFVELGLDSLSLTQMAIQVRQKYQVEVTFRQLMESQSTLDSLVEFLVGAIPEEAPVANDASGGGLLASAAPVPLSMEVSGVASSATLIEQVIRQQMQMMSQQLALLSGAHAVEPPRPTTSAQPEGPPVSAAVTVAADELVSPGSGPDELDSAVPDTKQSFGAIARISTGAKTVVTDGQRLRLDAFMRRYIARTKLSKEYTQAHRSHLADPRVVNSFEPIRKEITYQIVCSRSKGSRLWDIDGNEYVDALNGFGMSLFGWQPQFVVDAIHNQVAAGYEIGPQHPLAGEVAELVCELTGFDRVGLCNTGSEAVMGALRVARTVTGRSTIVIFTGAYHGIFDEVVVRATNKLRAFPAAPGIMPSAASNVLVLDYGSPESIEIIRSRGREIAAVLVEPVQSRRPEFQPRDFLRELREVTQDAGAVLIFDEVVTGFRCHPGGIQALFGVRADICTYGKVVGGGFPVGVIAGKREFMDALD